MTIQERRFDESCPCPVCGGYDRMERRNRSRCYGYLSKDGKIAFCSREEHAKTIDVNEGSKCYPHLINGGCNCGELHQCNFKRTNMKKNKPIKGFRTKKEAVIYLANKTSGKPVESHNYTEGFLVVKFSTPTGKTYYPIHKKEDKWFIGAPPGPLPLFQVDKVKEALGVIILEGTTAVKALSEWCGKSTAVAVTTSAHGSNGAKSSDWTPLIGRKIILIPDADKDGEHYVKSVAEILQKLDPKINIKIVRLTGLKPDSGEDVVDWISRGRTLDELQKLVSATTSEPIKDHCSEGLNTRHISEIYNKPEEKRDWLVDEQLITGGLSIFASKPKIGKSTLSRTLVKSVLHGEPWLGFKAHKGGVIYLALEEKISELKKSFRKIGISAKDGLILPQ